MLVRATMLHCNKALLVALFAGSALAQTPAPLVHISVAVTSATGILTGLKPELFRLYEDGKEQQIDTLTVQDVSKSIGILIDTSGSMTSKINAVRQAAASFVANSGAEDQFFLAGFGVTPQLIVDFTGSPTEIEAGLATISAAHRTALWDGVYFGLEKMNEAGRQRKILLVISDGVENTSHHAYKQVSELARRSDVEIYWIGIFDPYAVTPEERAGPQFLNELCEETGGLMFRVDDLTEMTDIAKGLSIELRHRYVIGYTPHDVRHDGRWRKVKVKVIRPQGMPPLTVHARTGYYAPLQ